MLVLQIGLQKIQKRLFSSFFDPQCLSNSSNNQVRIANGSQRDEADAFGKLRRVLPTPPGPVRVTKRTSGRRRRAHTACTSCSRPINGVSRPGKLWDRTFNWSNMGSASAGCSLGSSEASTKSV